MVWMYHILLKHSRIEEHLGRFEFLAIINKAAVNICIHIFVQT